MTYYTNIKAKGKCLSVGAVLHATRTCPRLRQQASYVISGAITKLLPKCPKCCSEECQKSFIDAKKLV